jgi:hypothetical protein
MNDPVFRRVSEPHIVSVTGHVLPWLDDHPVFLGMKGSEAQFLPLFSSVEKLREMMRMLDVTYHSIKKIDDGYEFIDSIPRHLPSGTQIRIIIDPYLNAEGKTRFAEVLRD